VIVIILQKNDIGVPYATGKCFSSRIGNYKYSTMYECYRASSSSSWEILEYKWLNNDVCSGTDDKYIVNNFTDANYTIHCGFSDCGKNVRTYSNCVASLKLHRQSYNEYPIALDQCLKEYNDPNDDPTTFDTYIYDQQYYMYSCIDGYLGVYYFLDSKCTDINTFTVANTSGSTCPTVIEGCSNGANMIHFASSLFISFLFFFFNF